MSVETIASIFEIGSAVVRHIFDAVKRGDHEEIRRLADVWPEPIRSRLALLEAEAKAKAAVRVD